MARANRKPQHITDRAADALDHATDKAVGRRSHSDTPVPGPSSNPATNLVINDILFRSVGRITRHTIEKTLLKRRYGSNFAKAAIENRSLLQTLATYGVTKLATKSVPGAAVVGTGLALKVLFDRSKSRRSARRAGEKMLRKQADPDSMV